ncbi:MAG: DUF493 domain-containing protein [Candidatus Marinimicrobia bacterium]|nr:DUF493 domain-containing protein [Candidatus Neomarinimicrobiota bacterium]
MKEKLKIKYPCKWDYKIIGNNYDTVVKAIENILDNEKNYKINLSKKSKTAKYVSINLNIKVDNENVRQHYFKSFSEHRDIKIVI